jgi:hypothetical protein
MAIDPKKNNQKLEIPPGEILFTEGTAAESLNVLVEGTIGFEKKLADGSSILISTLTGSNFTPGVGALLLEEGYPYTIRAKTPCLISTYPIPATQIRKNLQGKFSLSLMVAKTLLKEIAEIYKKVNMATIHSTQVERFLDNLSLIFYSIQKSKFQDITDGKPFDASEKPSNDPVMQYVRNNLSSYWDKGGALPEIIQAKFLEDDLSYQLTKKYEDDYKLDDPEFHFIRKFFLANPKVHQVLFEQDPTLIIYPSEKLSGMLKQMIELLIHTMETMDSNYDLFFSENSFLTKFMSPLETLNSGYSTDVPVETIQIAEEIIARSIIFKSHHKDFYVKDFPRMSSKFNAFQDLTKSLALKYKDKPTQKAAVVDVGFDLEGAKKTVLNSPSQIISYSGLDPEKAKEFVSMILKLKEMKNPLDPDQDARKLRKNIGKIYWDIYERSFKKFHGENQEGPVPVKLMLKYGFFDENFLDDSHIAFLFNIKEEQPKSKQVPVCFGIDHLGRIFKKEAPTSMDELGQSYFEKLKTDIKGLEAKKESELPPEIDTMDARLKYEMAAMFEPNVRLTSGSPGTHLPMFTKYHITTPLDKAFISVSTLEKAVEDILKIDYTPFYREVSYKNEEKGIKGEMVNVSVCPDFILVPSYGTKVMMWQELTIYRGPGSKESKGRITVPIFASGDIKTMLMEAIAAFRWELTKNILGSEWNNIAVPSITSEYSDYVQFFKKNKELSAELKEKLASEFKRFRSDRDRYANDYLQWMRYEADGTPRLNKVVRGIFYKHIPFAKPIRDKISTQPAYADFHNKFKNIKTRTLKELEGKYKKFMDASGKLPPQLQQNMDFFTV